MPTLAWAHREAVVRAATRAPFRLLEHDPALSFGDPDNENMLMQGDNLEGLKALLPFYAGRVKCFAIDPPYSARSAFEYYDDNIQYDQEKKNIGELWEGRSQGRGLFLWAVRKDSAGRDVHRQLEDKIEGRP